MAEAESQRMLPERGAERFGRNVEIHAIFMRHGEKGADGSLTDLGKAQGEAVGAGLEAKDAIKAYTSPVQRVIDTVEGAIAASPHERKLETRVRADLGIPAMSDAFFTRYGEVKARGEDPNDWFLAFGAERPDPETASPHEIAEMFAYLLMRYVRMAGRLTSGSRVDLLNGTHQSMPESLLKEVLVRKIDDKNVVGFDSLTEIGGALGYAENMDFAISTDAVGVKNLILHFRGETYAVAMDRLQALADAYAEKQKPNE